MRNTIFVSAALLLFSLNVGAHGAPISAYQAKPVLADLALLKQAQIPVLYSNPETGVGYAILTPTSEQRLSELAHGLGRCGGFESLEMSENPLNEVISSVHSMALQNKKANLYSAVSIRQVQFENKPEIQNAISQLRSDNLKSWVQWMSNFPSRYNKAQDPNVHVRALAEKLNALIQEKNIQGASVDLIDHKSTKQKSIRFHLEGSVHPDEIIVLGGHFDSIAQYGFGSRAPGADDNASGSSNLLEVLRVLLGQTRPERTVEFFWYAGEESGLLGSAEIAKSYKEQNKNVIAALQLDMTLFPGAGATRFGLMTDFTSPWLRDVLKGLNATYVGAEAIESQCGYGCSDHASWHRQGFPAVIPFEATMDTMNHSIHTEKDLITASSDFEHSLLFSKLALAFAMELGNSSSQQPF
ncbi:MAG: aminopeptidase [Bdellovibrio sp. CG10_big_fil_rev_8_21_14_0_10_47_8]|nr:MAG: aminopeptidase [Bdellovibrio sp. CG10_big_fil_rev_8_21_14_0_10_47_8]